MNAWFAGPERAQTTEEETANSVSHGIGLACAFVGAAYLILHAVQHGSVSFIVGASVFSASTILLYLASMLYHLSPVGRSKHVFRVIEHSAIFILIAGTYTPFTLGVLQGAWGWSLFGVVWGLASIGVVLKTIFQATRSWLFTSLYLLMGWVIVVAIEPMFERIPSTGLLLLLAGGLAYTVGVVFFALDARIKYGHLIWHLFVMIGTACHYFAVLWYAA